MRYGYRTDDELRLNAGLPEPIPSIVKITQAIEYSPGWMVRWAGRLLTLVSAVGESLETAELLHLAGDLLYSKVQGYTIGLVKYGSAHGSGGGVGTASATVIPPSEQLAD